MQSRTTCDRIGESRALGRGVVLGASVLLLLTASSEAAAQNTKKPDVLIVLDTSTDMLNTPNDVVGDCAAGRKSRWVMAMEALTGSISGGLDCGIRGASYTIPIESHSCRPFVNPGMLSLIGPFAFPSSNKRRWPVDYTLKPEERDAIVFCDQVPSDNFPPGGVKCTTGGGGWTGQACKVGVGNNKRWEQTADGILDTYSNQFRFGLATNDPMATTDALLGCTYQPTGSRVVVIPPPVYPCGTNYSCGLGTLGGSGSRCYSPTLGGGQGFDANEEWSYWFLDNTNYWGNGAAAHATYTAQVWNVDPAQPAGARWYTSDETTLDMGIRNPNAAPYQGRLIGFGPGDWNVSAAAIPITGCGSEDTCTQAHNEMVQKAMLGASRQLELISKPLAGRKKTMNTPLTAMMRDASEFMTADDTSQGVWLPHDRVQNPFATFPAGVVAGKIGPINDTNMRFVNPAGCREAAVIVVSTGVNNDDLLALPGTQVSSMASAENILTFPIALQTGMSQLYWTPGAGVGSLALAGPVDCASFDPTLIPAPPDPFAVGSICEPTADLAHYQYADGPYGASLTQTQIDKIRACCNTLSIARASQASGGTFVNGTSPAFASNGGELKGAINKILSIVGTKVLSRTIPLFTPATTGFRQKYGLTPDANIGSPVYFEIQTSVEVTADDTIWRGHVERFRYDCDAGLVPQINPVTPAAGDDFDDNVNKIPAGGEERKVFTVFPTDSSGNRINFLGSLRVGGTTANTTDTLFKTAGSLHGGFQRLPSGNDETVLLDVPQSINALKGALNALAGTATLDEALGITFPTDQNRCDSITNLGSSATLSQCTGSVLGWFIGQENPDGGATSDFSRVPGGSNPNAIGSGAALSGIRSVLGGIFKSEGVIIPPPQKGDSDESAFSNTRTNGTTSFVADFGDRPTMFYQQTTDGQLHAFAVTVNDFRTPATWGSVNGHNQINSNNNNEVWSFIPPAAFPSIFPNYNSQVRLTDGQVSWANVIPKRQFGFNGTTSSADEADPSFRTVLVAASGTSALGGFYYALDVTDPFQPRFLWQLSYAGNDPSGTPSDRLFGASAPGAAITHIRYQEPTGAADTNILAVAVLPGGNSYQSPPTKTIPNRRMGSTAGYVPLTHRPRDRIRDWGNSDPARSVTIVEVMTGRILGRMIGGSAATDFGDNPRRAGSASLNQTSLTSGPGGVTVPPNQTRFDSPMTGIPSAFPAGETAVAERIYLGDADGTVWRLNVSDPDPQQWSAAIAFDAYNRADPSNSTMAKAWAATTGTIQAIKGNPLGFAPSTTQAATMGQPIETAPLLALTPEGDVTVTFATGNQEDFATLSNGMVNVLVSFVDHVSGVSAGVPTYAALIDSSGPSKPGVEVAWQDGGRVTGPLNLFDGQLYFAYFTPQLAGGGCTPGTGGLCGFGYSINDSGVPRGYVDFDGSGVDVCADFSATFNPNAVVFGVSINARPSCEVADSSFTGTGTDELTQDPWMGGSYKTITQSNQLSYQLSFMTGANGVTPNNAFASNSKFNLPAPKSKTRVRTWVSVVE